MPSTPTHLPTPFGDANWRDVLPAVPLARGVPIAGLYPLPDGPVRGVVVVSVNDIIVVRWDTDDVESSHRMLVRIDLDDPQGFAYALRLLLKAVAVERDHDLAYVAPEDPRHAYERAWRTAMRLSQDYAVLRGEVTDADRLALATALAEVAS